LFLKCVMHENLSWSNINIRTSSVKQCWGKVTFRIMRYTLLLTSSVWSMIMGTGELSIKKCEKVMHWKSNQITLLKPLAMSYTQHCTVCVCVCVITGSHQNRGFELFLSTSCVNEIIDEWKPLHVSVFTSSESRQHLPNTHTTHTQQSRKWKLSGKTGCVCRHC